MEKNNFKVMLYIKKDTENEQVFFKTDGQRFSTDKTIKLTVDTSYGFSVITRPPQIIQNISVMGTNVNTTEMTGDSSSLTYTFSWPSTGTQLTTKGKRDILPVVLEVKDNGSLTMNLQIKFYKLEDKQHYTWGTPLNHIEFECESKSGTSFVDIVKQTYR
ncbi:CB1 cannabinoid receptor-interacting protein 1-like isoform X1 [Limulus polyphemus]|uniref:CB1 cannabinoid receptor-interacting protein 1 n=1 Tax=Limulus polyphemus TaxID=6850 RepID=A0ABM1BBH9_LIMPO|nr:CB1 cannabinoid receptor-interacting protein 1-like isoform X1 [Limulus polyphemus]